jgi:hypothetical protein
VVDPNEKSPGRKKQAAQVGGLFLSQADEFALTYLPDALIPCTQRGDRGIRQAMAADNVPRRTRA